ncbi:uncharacterized protein LOC126674435 [Mercurialis annua]|uniref:uncharacterized protein LOC126674435 n=1 Tax=Mercurialis annua TaxID=3986 RepID=UPI00215F2FA6|nr:uncharacterized protein LOC126674435 [Mercurialis annua]
MQFNVAGTSFRREMEICGAGYFTENGMIVRGHGGKRRIIEGSEEDFMRIERKKIKNRASAARSREKKVERTKYLEEKVEELREENAQLERLVKLLQMEEEEEKEMHAIEETAEKLNGLRRTLSAPMLINL